MRNRTWTGGMHLPGAQGARRGRVRQLALWPGAAIAFFTLMSAGYERGSVILTSDKGFREWGELLGDTVIALPVQDRLLDHRHVLNIRRESYRLREKTTGWALRLASPAQGRTRECQPQLSGLTESPSRSSGGSIPNRRRCCWPTTAIPGQFPVSVDTGHRTPAR